MRLKYSPIVLMKISNMNWVGPAKITISMMPMATTMLMFDRILMPLSTPVVADSI